MTSDYIYKRVEKALLGRYAWYYHVDGLHVYYFGKHFSMYLDVFSEKVLQEITRYLDKHGYQYTTNKASRGGYLGGGIYREFTGITITSN